ncbi:permeases of the major facilitator superfamily [Stylonychia lemnae]|uniref:Permeases of the major facilitator superfamily n=1 Tax=Stylonychia lemnae TaxID=5949 RepID=A0A078ACY0_STYLE|nr:permeases of the major facilitator superfamily [Stylonychia lemnae]|eukprot:CDW79392.1 permeases of the major facilitator superfamily [Stylonychia lemnae]
MKANFRISQRHNLSSRLARVSVASSIEPMSRCQSAWRQSEFQKHSLHKIARPNPHKSEHLIRISINGGDNSDFQPNYGNPLLVRSPQAFSPKQQDAESDEQQVEKLPEVPPDLLKERKNILIAVLASLFTIQLFFLNIESILPTYIDDNHKGLTETHTSVIMITMELACFILAPLVGVQLERIGKKNSIIIGFVIMVTEIIKFINTCQVLSTIGLALTAFIEDDWWYFGICNVVRLLQGLGDIGVQTSCYSILTSIFPENREKYLGYGEASAGVGLMVGPVIGGLLYSYLGYFWCFIIFSLIILITTVLCFFVLPASLNRVEENLDENGEQVQSNGREVTYWMFLSNRRALFAFTGCGIICILTSYSSGYLTVVLSDQMNVSSEYIGLILALPAAAYIISSIAVNYFVEYIPRRIFIFATFLVYTFAILLMGPSQLLDFPKDLYIFLIGYFVSGIAQGFLFIPILPEVIDSIYIKTGYTEGEDLVFDGLVSDKAAALYGSFYSLGLIVAPLLGSWVYQLVDSDWPLTCDYFAIFAASFSLIFFLGNVLPDILNDKKEKEELEGKRSEARRQTDRSMFLKGRNFSKFSRNDSINDVLGTEKSDKEEDSTGQNLKSTIAETANFKDSKLQKFLY